MGDQLFRMNIPIPLHQKPDHKKPEAGPQQGMKPETQQQVNRQWVINEQRKAEPEFFRCGDFSPLQAIFPPARRKG
ncbi:MAG: hypothetical protein U5L96_06110 [Owenweeksia sp.]|nr:hypothetical protein [Owenweeksia sp.]